MNRLQEILINMKRNTTYTQNQRPGILQLLLYHSEVCQSLRTVTASSGRAPITCCFSTNPNPAFPICEI